MQGRGGISHNGPGVTRWGGTGSGRELVLFFLGMKTSMETERKWKD